MKQSALQKKLARVDQALDKAIEAAEIPGAVVLARMPRPVAHRENHGEGLGRVAGEAALGSDGKNRELLEHLSVRGLAVVRPERVAMTRETIFDLASLTKPIATTTAILWLVHDGLIALDDPVAKHLPAFAVREKELVTIRHLLTHSSGMKPWRAFHEEMLEREKKKGERLIWTPQAKDWVLERIFSAGLVHHPGEAAVYADLDFITLGALVETVAQEPFDSFCARRIFEPLGLENTRFIRLNAEGIGLVEPERRRVAATENCPWRDRILWGEVHDPNASVMGGVAGHAGLFAPIDDVMRFAQTIVDVWHGRSDALPKDLLHLFLTRQGMPPESDWALGWDTPTPGASSSGQYFSANSVGHLGFTGTSLWIDLEREAIVVMLTNRVHLIAKKSRFELRPEIHDLILEAFLGEGSQ